MKRDAKTGRFLPGNKGGPGRPSKLQEQKYLEILMNSVTEQQFEIAVKACLKHAMQGDYYALKLLGSWLLPSKPKIINLNIDAEVKEIIEHVVKELLARNLDPSTVFQEFLNELAVEADYIDITENEENYE